LTTNQIFQKILVPVSSESYSIDVIKRSIYLAEIFHASVRLLYIIEERPLIEMKRQTDTHRTHYDRTETEHELVNQHRKTADDIVFEDAMKLYQQKNIPIKQDIFQGEFSTIVTNEIEKEGYDLVVMSYEKGCMVDYSLLDELAASVWIEAGGHHESILAVCSNLAPNQQVPDISINLAQLFQWPLTVLYVIDTQDAVKVDENGRRSIRKPKEELYFTRQEFAETMLEKGINVQTTEGTLENETIKAANTMAAGLVIIGREQKRRGSLGLPIKSIKQKMAEKCKYSLLFIK
jgi:nucleotide-binding universal stress UspA family protein